MMSTPWSKPSLTPLLNESTSALPPTTARCPPRLQDKMTINLDMKKNISLNVQVDENKELNNTSDSRLTSTGGPIVHSPSVDTTVSLHHSNESLVGVPFSKYYKGYGDCPGIILEYDAKKNVYIGLFENGSKTSMSKDLVEKLRTDNTINIEPDEHLTNLALGDFIFDTSGTSSKPPTPVNVPVAGNRSSIQSGYESPSTPDTIAAPLPPSMASLVDTSLPPLPSKKKENKSSAYHAAKDIKKGPWTEIEDDTVRKGVKDANVDSIKSIKWSDLAMKVPGRTGKQVRERWYNHLDPAVNKGPWTEAEMRTLHRVHATFGNQWSKIAESLPGRTQNHIKNRWNSIKRKMNRVTSGKIVILLGDEQENAVHVSHRQHQQQLKQRSKFIAERKSSSNKRLKNRKRSMSTSDAGNNSSSSSKRSNSSSRGNGNKKSSRSTKRSLKRARTSSSSSSSFGFTNELIDLHALSNSVNGWMLSADTSTSQPHPLMNYLELCADACEFNDLNNVTNLLRQESTRMEKMMDWLANDIEQEDKTDVKKDNTSPSSDESTGRWSPHMMVYGPQAIAFHTATNDIDWWEKSMVSEDDDELKINGAKNEHDNHHGVPLNICLSDSKETGHNMGPTLVDTSVQVEWGESEDNKKWYKGKVVDFQHPQHCIQYENGEIEWVTLYRDCDNGVVWRSI